MFKVVLALIFPLLVLASPQVYGPLPGPATNPTSATPVAAAVPSAPPDTPGHVNVDVGFNNGFVFNPSNFTAPNGTIVTFFFPNNGIPHSVVQSSFADPCTPLAATNSTPAGFDSGITAGTQFTLNITDDAIPIWFFCKFPLHCGMGMVGSINAPTNGTNTFDAFQAAATQIGAAEPSIMDNGPVTGGVGADATAAPMSASASASATAGTSTTGGSSSDAGHLAVASSLCLASVIMGAFLAL